MARCHLPLGPLRAAPRIVSSVAILTLTVLKTYYLPTSQGSWEGGLPCILTMFELSFGVERPGGKSGIVNSHQAPSPVLCLHSASSSVWEDRGKARLSLARCFWKQFSYPAEPEGEYYNRGRDRRPIYHRVVTLRENKLFFPACHGAQVDAN